jgi:glycosyltransferase involved in cell wall biosynthesis
MNRTIGALILTKNSRDNIQATLNSVMGICSAVVVVDTGSDDDTPAIAARNGAEVYFFKWIDDFSAARNFALKHLKTDWILMLDSDEILNDFDNNLFQKLTSDKKVGGINVMIKNQLNDSENQTINIHRYTRLFVNNNRINFKGKIHEQIRDSIESAGLSIVETDFSIIHLGYGIYNEEKNQRNLKMIADEVESNPNDDWLKYHLAATHFSAGRDKESLDLFSEILDSKQLSIEQNEIVKLRLAQLSLKYDKYEEILKLTDFSASNSQNEALRLYVTGTALLYLNRAEEAKTIFSKCLDINSPSLNSEDISRALQLAIKMLK